MAPDGQPDSVKAPDLRVAWVCVCLALAVFAVFGRTAGFGFVDYDDRQNVYDNPVVEKGLSARSAGWAFTHNQVLNWVPLATLSHMLDCQLFGLRAGGHHLVNVLLHAATAVLLFLVLRQMSGSLWRSAFVAALFALHPLRAESVAWISERKDVLSGFFFMLSIGAYVRHVREPKSGGMILVMAAFALGLLAKSMVATLPFVLLLLDYWPLGRFEHARPFRNLIVEKLPLFVLSAAACMATALAPGLIIVSAGQLPFLQRIGNALVSYVVYLRQMFYPAGLAIPYPMPPHGQPMGAICAAFVLLTAISAVVFVCRKSRPFLLTGWLWYLGMLFPVIGIVQFAGDAAHADRYTYLPGIGVAIALTWMVAERCAGWKYEPFFLAGAMGAVIAALSVRAGIQTSYWRDDESLWTRSLACSRANYVAHFNLANTLVKRNQLEDAVKHFQQSLELQPSHPEVHYNLGNTFFKQGKWDDAIAQYRDALQLEPDHVDVLNDLANALAMKGADNAALEQYQKVLNLHPEYGRAHYNFGQFLLKRGSPDQAAAQFRAVLDAKPDDADARNGLGKALLAKGDFDGAMACFPNIANPGLDALARWLKLGDGFLQSEDWPEAVLCYRHATKIDPRSTDACSSLGLALFKNGDSKEAIDSWQKALHMDPGQFRIQNNLAWLLATASDKSLRDGARAVALATQASQLSGGANPVIVHTLAVAYAEKGDYRQAALAARRALELALEARNSALAATLQKELELYETNSPAPNPRH